MKTRTMQLQTAMSWRERQRGKIGYILFWLAGVPLPVLFLVYLLRGCN